MNNTIKIALASPKIRLCDPEYNAKICAECAKEADARGADIIVFPELTLSGATCGDLYLQEVLTEKSEAALKMYMSETEKLDVMSFIGLPISSVSSVYNSVAAISYGEILGITASGEENNRPFSKVPHNGKKITVAGKKTELARDLVYTDEKSGAAIFVKVGCDEVYSRDYVNIIVNPTAEPEYTGLAANRREYAEAVSEKLGLGFVICGAGEGESGTDGIYAAARLVAFGGEIKAESKLFDSKILYSEISLKPQKKAFKKESSSAKITKFPFIPEDEAERAEALELALEIQSRALAARAERAYAKTLVIGVSGGLDSTLAVLAAARAADILGRERSSVLAITMPCFGTTERTKSNALSLASELGCTVKTIDIKAAVTQHFLDISHDENNYNVVYENAQARERTQILMDIANAEGGMVVGTGDLSELALGFATYNGDHMSMYCVNGSVPKTMMRAIIAHAASNFEKEGKAELAEVLTDVINTPVSPELLPVSGGENKQHTESIVGPYELHDFFLYYAVKFGYSPKKILKLAAETFADYNTEEIKRYLQIFFRRFISQQFKRSCLPDGPRVTEISLSPRTSWKMPSDAAAKIWLESLEEM